MPRRHVTTGATAVVLLALLASTACTGTGNGAGSGEQPPRLSKAWEFSLGKGPKPTLIWSSTKTLVFRQDDQLLGRDPESGKQRWKLKPPGLARGVCNTSTELNSKGIGGVLMRTATGCTQLAAVDSATGRVLWSKSTGELDNNDRAYTPSRITLSAGGKAVSVSMMCGDMRRFRATDGAALPSPATGAAWCRSRYESAYSRNHTAVLTRSAPRPMHPGQSPILTRIAEGHAELALYDADSGRRLWQQPARRTGSAVHRIIADDPLTLDLTESGQRHIRTFDSTGRPQRVIGKGLITRGPERDTRVTSLVHKGVAVLAGYRHDPAAYAYDLRTGALLWKRGMTGERLLGVRNGRLLTAATVHPTAATRKTQPRLMSYSLRGTGKSTSTPQTLGRLPGRAAAVRILGHDALRIYTYTSGKRGAKSLVAYTLPASGSTEQYAGAATLPTPSAERLRKGELTQAQADAACAAVSARSVRLMWLHRTPTVPEDCTWQESDLTGLLPTNLTVRIIAHRPQPARGRTEPMTATETARQHVRGSGGSKSDGKFAKDARPVSGFGAEARATFNTSRSDESTTARLKVRHRNATVDVRASVDSLPPTRRDVPPRQQVEAAVLAAAADVLRKLGAQVDPPAAPQPGAVRTAKPLCDLFAADSKRLVPGSKPFDLTPKRAPASYAGCAWETGADDSSDLQVLANAVTGSRLTGRSAQQAAAAEVAAARRKEGFAKVDGLGDEALLRREDIPLDETATAVTFTLLVRKDNLLIEVEYSSLGNASPHRMEAEVKRLAERALAAYR